jgi:hypothetical protein
MFDAYPEFRKLCLSKSGYTPAGALASLAAYASNSPVARDLMVEAQKQRPFWESSMKATDPNAGAGAEGGITVVIQRWAASGSSRADALSSARYLGQQARNGDREILDAFNGKSVER